MAELTQVLQDYQHYGGLAFVVTVFLTPLAMRAAQRYDVLDVPDRNLKPHARPIPYLGGTAICAAWTVTLIAGIATGLCDWQVMLPVMLGGIAMSLLGLADDVRHVAPKLRLLIGTVVITTVLALTGIGQRMVGAVVYGTLQVLAEAGVSPPPPIIDTIEWAAPLASLVIGILVVLGACNSANLIDGLDGLCSGVTAIISLGFFLLASHLAIWEYSETGDPIRLVLAIAMFGAAVGFLPWNFNPAKIFMGDAGSMLLGYNCGMLILLFAEKGKFRWVIAALMIFALPVFDTALAMFRRWRAGRSIFEGDRSHFYDQLVQRGLSVRQTVLISYFLTVIYALVGLLMIWVQPPPAGSGLPGSPVIRTRYAVPLYVGVALLTALLAWASGLTYPEEPRKPKAPQDPKTP
jgi:UDP-GlcNAc:undecaprenyl-phosphate GlcNAc-1-phosphate transferase